MNRIATLLLLGTVQASAQASAYTNFIRQSQQDTGVVWDMPVVPSGSSPSALVLGSGGSLFQLWTIQQASAADYLLDQKLVGAYLPTADIKITTLDPYSKVHRTRVDQPFTVTITVGGLLTGANAPLAATQVLFERHIGAYQAGMSPLVPAVICSNTPLSSAYLEPVPKPRLFGATSRSVHTHTAKTVSYANM